MSIKRYDDLSNKALVFTSVSKPREKWQQLKESHFPPESREERIRAAVQAIESAVVHYDLDRETMIWLAEDVDLEDM